MTIIWEPQSGASAEGASRRCKHHIRELSGVQLGSGGSAVSSPQRGPGPEPRPPAIFLYIIYEKNR